MPPTVVEGRAPSGARRDPARAPHARRARRSGSATRSRSGAGERAVRMRVVGRGVVPESEWVRFGEGRRSRSRASSGSCPTRSSSRCTCASRAGRANAGPALAQLERDFDWPGSGQAQQRSATSAASGACPRSSPPWRRSPPQPARPRARELGPPPAPRAGDPEDARLRPRPGAGRGRVAGVDLSPHRAASSASRSASPPAASRGTCSPRTSASCPRPSCPSRRPCSRPGALLLANVIAAVPGRMAASAPATGADGLRSWDDGDRLVLDGPARRLAAPRDRGLRRRRARHRPRPDAGASARCSRFSMLAAAIIALLYVPVRAPAGRASPTARAPAAARPTMSCAASVTGLTRALPLDELLLQLAESLRRDARARRGRGLDGLRRACSSGPPRIPTPAGASLSSTPAERAVVARAGVAGAGLAAAVAAAAARAARGRGTGRADHARGRAAGAASSSRAATRSTDDGRAGAGRARAPGRPRAPQRPARLGAPGLARRAAAAGRRAARVARTRRRRGRRRAPAHRARPARRRPAAPRRAGREPRGWRASSRTPTRRRRERCSTSSRGEVQDALEEFRDLAHGIYPPLLVDRGLADGLRAAPRARPGPGAGRGAKLSAATRPRSRRRSTSAASRRCRTSASTPAPARSATVRVWEDEDGLLFEVADDGARLRSRAGGRAAPA